MLKNIIKGRFPEAEPYILHSKYNFVYEKNFLKKLGLTWRDLKYDKR